MIAVLNKNDIIVSIYTEIYNIKVTSIHYDKFTTCTSIHWCTINRRITIHKHTNVSSMTWC